MVKAQSKIVIATRRSELALWQSNWVKLKLLALHPELTIELLELTTRGDKNTRQPLQQIGGKSLFVKELQQAVLTKQADIAVHSIKDMSAFATPGLELAAICQRADPRDAFISNQYSSVNNLPAGAIVGTASPRRQALLLNARNDLVIKCLRGNVYTRLKKLANGEYDAIILAAAGLQRLQHDHVIRDFFDPLIFTPAIGQGAIGIECRAEDESTRQLLAPLSHPTTTACVTAERIVNQQLGADCFSAVGAYAQCNNQQLHLHAMVATTDGKKLLRATANATLAKAIDLGQQVAKQLIEQGAMEILNHV